MFLKRGGLVSAATRRTQIRGGANNEGGVCQMGDDYKENPDFQISGSHHGIFLFTADVMELKRGKKSVVTLVTEVRPTDRNLAVKVNPALYVVADISAPSWIDPADTGQIVLTMLPREDLNLADFDHIVKLMLEGFA